MEGRVALLEGDSLLQPGGRIYLVFEVEWAGHIHLCRDVADDTYTLFWCDPWLDEGVLKVIFSSIFTLANNKMATIIYFQFRLRRG